MIGRDEKQATEGESGLDARLDRAVPTEAAVGFLLAGDGTQPGRVFPLTRNTNVVGRSEKADVRISQPAVSSEHARIINGSLGFEVEDLGSVNGTFLNGVRITRAKLQRGDRLTLGNVEFTFLMEKTQDQTMALLPPRARRTGTLGSVRAVNQIAVRDRYDDGEEGLSWTDIITKGVTVYRTVRPYLPMAGKLAAIGVVLGVGSAVALPPPKTAVCEAKLHPVKKANPVDGESRPQEGESLQFFVDAERSFVIAGLVRSTLEKLEGKVPDDARVAQVQSRLRLDLVGERLYRAVYFEPAFGTDPIPSLKLLEAHVNNYLTSDVEKGLRSLDNESKFLADKLATTSADLTRINGELAAFKKANADDLPETSEQAHSSRYYLDTRKSELTAQIARLAGELAVDEAALKEGNPLAQSKFQSSQVYRTSLQELKRRLSEAYSRGLADGHPEIQQMKNEMERLEKVIEQEMNAETSVADRASDPAYSGLRAKVGVARATLKATQIELQEVERNIERVKRAVTTMPAVAAKLDDLQRRYDSTKRLHDQLSDQSQKAKLQLEVERLAAQSRYEILTPPFLTKPNLPKTYLTRAGIGLGVALALAIALMAISEARKFITRHLASSSRPA